MDMSTRFARKCHLPLHDHAQGQEWRAVSYLEASKSSPTGVRVKANSSFPLVAAAMATSSSSNALKFLRGSQQLLVWQMIPNDNAGLQWRYHKNEQQD